MTATVVAAGEMNLVIFSVSIITHYCVETRWFDFQNIA